MEEENETTKKMVNRSCGVSQASNMSLIEADAWQTRVHSIAPAPTEAADRG